MLGTAYYPEHWEEDRIEKDLSAFRNNGIEFVRIGEFMWSVLEPEEGKYNLSLLKKTMDICKTLQIKVILSTPSATPPAWLISKYPQILQKDIASDTRNFGGRRHYCYNSKEYALYVSKIVELLASEFSSHDALYAWQIDNEFGCEDTSHCFCEKCDESFRAYLEDKYGDIGSLNKAWGTVFWSQIYNSFSQITTPKKISAIPNPHQMLDFYRFSSISVKKFAQMQTDILRKYSDKPVTTNFMVNFTNLDYCSHQELYDFISFDNYNPSAKFDPLQQAFNLDLMWSLKRKNFTVMEQQPGRVNWQNRNLFFPAKWLVPSTIQAFLHGAENLSYFRDRAVSFGAEQYHNGLMNYEGNPDTSPRLKVVKKLSEEVSKLSSRPKAKVAIYFDYEVAWMHKINGVCKDFDYVKALQDIYAAFRYFGYFVDFIFRDSKIENYEIVVLPYALYVPKNFMKKLEKYQGSLFITCMSNIKDENNSIISDRPLGWKIKDLSFTIKDFGAIYEEYIDYKDHGLVADMWIEELEVIEGKQTGTWESSPLKKGPALIAAKNSDITYISTVLSKKSWRKLLKYTFKPELEIKESLELITNDKESYFINFDSEEQRSGHTDIEPYNYKKTK
ncbi:MAG TPA: beta-galactosidase [Petrotogaceae bacterium]|nr:beta-galactosidase [Petrotogaceae bacterium]HQO12125.1 beta-galactosidase [Petrotogaceae bacterium]